MPASRWGSFFFVATLTGVWGLALLGFGIYFGSCVSFYDPMTAAVDVWSPTEGVKHVAPLERAYDVVQPTRAFDGRIFLTTTDRDTSPTTERLWEWDRNTSRFSPAPSMPAQEVPPGVDTKDTTIRYTTSGRVLVMPRSSASGGVTMLFDHGWRQVDAVPQMSEPFDAIDLSDGGLLVIVNEPGGSRAAILEPRMSAWKDLTPPANEGPRPDPASSAPMIRWVPFAAPGAKIALLDPENPSRLWDPRSGTLVTLPGPAAMRQGAAAVSIDEGHVLIAGGHAVKKTWSLSLYLEASAMVGWLALGFFGARRVLRMSRETEEAAAVRRYALSGLWLVMTPTLIVLLTAWLVLAFVHFFGIPMGRM